MKKKSVKIYLAISLGIIILISFWGIKFLRSDYFTNDYYCSNEQVVGIFNRRNLSNTLPAKPIICYTAVFKNTAIRSSRGNVETALANNDVLITVETWLKGVDYKNNVLTKVLNGGFDKQIHELAVLAAKSHHQVFIRWNPDMEVPASVFPWQYKSPKDYITSFNYFSKKN